jgi:membrane-bound ClpP family serine protease
MTFFELSETQSAIAALLTVLGMFVLFVRESYPTEVVAITGVAFLLILGVLPYENALTVLSNPAPWTIAAMFIVMGALVRTGALERVYQARRQTSQDTPKGSDCHALGVCDHRLCVCVQYPCRRRHDPCFCAALSHAWHKSV